MDEFVATHSLRYLSCNADTAGVCFFVGWVHLGSTEKVDPSVDESMGYWLLFDITTLMLISARRT